MNLIHSPLHVPPKFKDLAESQYPDDLQKKERLAGHMVTYMDAIVGLSWTGYAADRWSFTLAGDGNFAGDSERNILLEGRVGFKISKLNNVWFGYRYSQIKLEPDVEGPKVVTDFRQHGPTIGWAFTF